MKLGGLVALSVFGAGACAGMVALFRNKVSQVIAASEPYQEAIKLVKSHKGAIQFLGEPIDDVYVHYAPKSFFHQDTMEFEIGVTGSKDKGKVFVTTSGEEIGSVKIETVQLELLSDSTKRLVIKETDDS